MTVSEALWKLAGLRRNGFTQGKVDAWAGELDEWNGEQVYKAGQKLCRAWTDPGDWQIADLLRVLPPTERVQDALVCFGWDPVTGRAYGDWGRFDKLGEDERLAIALHLLHGLTPETVMLHEHTAVRMHSESLTMRDMLAAKKDNRTGALS